MANAVSSTNEPPNGNTSDSFNSFFFPMCIQVEGISPLSWSHIPLRAKGLDDK
jgi:hypothetical protein